MAQKQKLLIWSDAPVMHTGFGEVARNLFQDLHKEYEVDIVGINYFGLQKYDQSKWYIYPVQATNIFGTDILEVVLKQNKYDKFLLFQDIFHISKVLEIYAPLLKGTKIYTYFPIDGGPLHSSWQNFINDKNITNITYTKFAIDTLKESYPDFDISNIKYLYHGVAPEFKLLPSQVRKGHKKDMGFSDKFVALNVNRYQPRKNISATLRAWSLFSKGYKLCSCGNAYPKHLNYCDANRCDSSQIVKETLPKDDVSLYLHMNPQSKSNGPGESNNLASVALKAGFVDADLKSGKINILGRDSYSHPLTTEQMNLLYNIADVNISTAVGEGVGLSLIESAMTGTTSIAPRNSAIIEMLEGHGILVDNVPNGIQTNAYDNSYRRPNVDTLKFANALEQQYALWEQNGRRKIINQVAIDIAKNKFQWEDKREFLHDILKNS